MNKYVPLLLQLSVIISIIHPRMVSHQVINKLLILFYVSVALSPWHNEYNLLENMNNLQRKASNNYNKVAVWVHYTITRQGFLNHISSILLLQGRDGIIWYKMTLSEFPNPCLHSSGMQNHCIHYFYTLINVYFVLGQTRQTSLI